MLTANADAYKEHELVEKIVEAGEALSEIKEEVLDNAVVANLKLDDLEEEANDVVKEASMKLAIIEAAEAIKVESANTGSTEDRLA